VPVPAGAGSPNEASTTSSVSAAMDGESSPMRKKSLPRKSSNSPLREPNKASSGETVRFCWRTSWR